MSNEIDIEKLANAHKIALHTYDDECYSSIKSLKEFAEAYHKQKCEQSEAVAFLRFISREYLVNSLVGMDIFVGYEVCEKHEKGDDGSDAFPVYKAPQQSAGMRIAAKDK